MHSIQNCRATPDSVRQLILSLGIVLTAISPLRAAVTSVAWYRLGENDPGAKSGLAVANPTTDLMGVRHLQTFGSPLYTNAVSTSASERIGSSLSVHFNGGNQYLSNAVVSTAVDNFGIEAWVKPNTTSFGSYVIAANGRAPDGGWALFQDGSRYAAYFGGLFDFGNAPASPGTWAHLALVRENGVATFYFNGTPAGTAFNAPLPPVGGFSVGAAPSSPPSFLFNGCIDEVRVFTFVPGKFSTNDLLLSLKRVETIGAGNLGPTMATLHGTVYPGGPSTVAWFEWGTTTNYGNSTVAQSIGSGTTNLNFNTALSGLTAGLPYHFRAVASNSLGVSFGVNRTFSTFSALYFDDFDTDHSGNWIVNHGPGQNAADFRFDYSTVGIPPAPRSASTTRGLKLEANFIGNTFGGLSVSPRDQSFPGHHVLSFDIWWNHVIERPGVTGSTQVTGAGVGTDGYTPQWASGNHSVLFGITGDGGSGIGDYRAYSEVVTTQPNIQSSAGMWLPGSGFYAASGSGNPQDNTHPHYAGIGGSQVPAVQTQLDPGQTGTSAPGTPAFRWRRGLIIKNENAITFRLDGLLIATLNLDNDYGTISLGGNNILFTQFDVNASSVSDGFTRQFQFGLIDNVKVTAFDRPAWLSIARLSETHFQLIGAGIPDLTYTVESATNAAFTGTVTTLGSATAAPSGLIQFDHFPPPSNASRFYRLRWP